MRIHRLLSVISVAFLSAFSIGSLQPKAYGQQAFLADGRADPGVLWQTRWQCRRDHGLSTLHSSRTCFFPAQSRSSLRSRSVLTTKSISVVAWMAGSFICSTNATRSLHLQCRRASSRFGLARAKSTPCTTARSRLRKTTSLWVTGRSTGATFKKEKRLWSPRFDKRMWAETGGESSLFTKG